MGVDEALAAKILAMELESEGEPVKSSACYRLQPDRLARFLPLVPTLTAQNAVAVTALSPSYGLCECIVDAETMTHHKYEDAIMMTEVPLAGLVEAQFVEGGEWILSRG